MCSLLSLKWPPFQVTILWFMYKNVSFVGLFYPFFLQSPRSAPVYLPIYVHVTDQLIRYNLVLGTRRALSHMPLIHRVNAFLALDRSTDNSKVTSDALYACFLSLFQTKTTFRTTFRTLSGNNESRSNHDCCDELWLPAEKPYIKRLLVLFTLNLSKGIS